MKVYILVSLLCVLAKEAQTKSLIRQRRNAQSSNPTTPVGNCSVSSALTEAEAANMLTLHNDYRKAEPASNMMRLNYSVELASRAQEYAKQCYYEHGLTQDCSGKRLGQNMFFGAGGKAGIFNATATMGSWQREKRNYNITNDTCNGVCGHYKQMMNSKAREVGCGYEYCPILTELDTVTEERKQIATDAVLVICDYSPGLAFDHIYKVGENCADCPGETKCVDGMCVPCSLEEEGCVCTYTLDICLNSVNIEDTWLCRIYKQWGDCDGGAWQDWMLEYCAQACNCHLINKQPERCQVDLPSTSTTTSSWGGYYYYY